MEAQGNEGIKVKTPVSETGYPLDRELLKEILGNDKTFEEHVRLVESKDPDTMKKMAEYVTNEDKELRK